MKKDINLFHQKNTIFLKPITSKSQLSGKDKADGYFINSSEKEIRRIIDVLKNKGQEKIITVQGRDDIFNRRILEKTKINYLVSPEAGERKDTLKQRDSGLNHVLAKIAKKNNISIIINFSEINSIKDKKQKALRLSRIMQNIKICRKAKCPIKIASFAKNKSELRDEHTLKAFGFSLGMSSQQVAGAGEF